MNLARFLLLVIVYIICTQCHQTTTSRSFIVDYENNVFLKDGKPFRYISGSIHYFRVPRTYWYDRLLKMKAAGLNAIQTYVAWQVHERVEGEYDFEGENDFVNFTKIAGSLGLLVIIRAGPFIAAERDMGGFPPWLLKNYTAEYSPRFRTLSNTAYMSAVDRWMKVLLPKIKPLVYSNGGPVIAVQVENEYGSIEQCDHQYLAHLQDLFMTYLGKDVVLFTNNGCANRMLECGTLPGMLSTLDFGGGYVKHSLASILLRGYSVKKGNPGEECFKNQRYFQPSGPLVNSEFYPGWINNWGIPFQRRDADTVAKNLDSLLSANISVNVYMFHGGTNFGFMNGANIGKVYEPQITSYDYDAPISEAGDPTHKYLVMREVILKHQGVPPMPVPPPTTKHAYGAINMTKVASLFEVLEELSPVGPKKSHFTQTMENVGQNYGFMLYRTQIPSKYANKQVELEIAGLRDRGIIFVGQVRQATLHRSGPNSTMLTIERSLTLDILVENQGHHTGSSDMQDPKGIVGNVTINKEILTSWEMYPLNLDNITGWEKPQIHSTSKVGDTFTPTFYSGLIFPTPDGIPKDTFIRFRNWHKGQLYVNGFNLGRYWPDAGPQETLYVPASFLSAGQQGSRVVLFELDDAPCDIPLTCVIESVSVPILNGTVHPLYPRVTH